MTDAPERIWIDGDATTDEGVFPRCFANPKYASDPPMEFVRADVSRAAVEAAYIAGLDAARGKANDTVIRKQNQLSSDDLRDREQRMRWAAGKLQAALIVADIDVLKQPALVRAAVAKLTKGRSDE
jgi:hypothetical protein